MKPGASLKWASPANRAHVNSPLVPDLSTFSAGKDNAYIQKVCLF